MQFRDGAVNRPGWRGLPQDGRRVGRGRGDLSYAGETGRREKPSCAGSCAETRGRGREKPSCAESCVRIRLRRREKPSCAESCAPLPAVTPLHLGVSAGDGTVGFQPTAGPGTVTPSPALRVPHNSVFRDAKGESGCAIPHNSVFRDARPARVRRFLRPPVLRPRYALSQAGLCLVGATGPCGAEVLQGR